jgi:hypothetical protein
VLWRGRVWRSLLGPAGLGVVWTGLAVLLSSVLVGLVVVRRSRLGEAGSGMARSGMAVEARLGVAGSGSAVMAGRGVVWYGAVWYGGRGGVRQGTAGPDEAVRVRLVKVCSDWAAHGLAV